MFVLHAQRLVPYLRILWNNPFRPLARDGADAIGEQIPDGEPIGEVSPLRLTTNLAVHDDAVRHQYVIRVRRNALGNGGIVPRSEAKGEGGRFWLEAEIICVRVHKTRVGVCAADFLAAVFPVVPVKTIELWFSRVVVPEVASPDSAHAARADSHERPFLHNHDVVHKVECAGDVLHYLSRSPHRA